MKPNIIIFLIIFFLNFKLIFGQEQTINFNYADSVRNWNWDLGVELRGILTYNDAVKFFDYDDTIKIVKIENHYNYYYKDSQVTDLRYRDSNKQKLIMIDYSGSPEFSYMFSSTQQSSISKFELVVLGSFDRHDLVYKLTNYANDIKLGRYEERTKTGQVLVTGQYCQVDSMYVDTLKHFDPETYEDIIEIKHRTKFAIQSGVWYYYSPEGILLKKEKHKTCT